MAKYLDNLAEFIKEERAYLTALDTGINWDDKKWDVKDWLFHRGTDFTLLFTSISSSKIKTNDKSNSILPKVPLPDPFSAFVKAVAIYLFRTKGVGFVAIRNYVNECRKLYMFMYERNEVSPEQLTKWHFEQLIDFLKSTGYKNIYDASANLKVIADLIDKKQLTPYSLDFTPGISPNRSYHDYTSVKDIEDDIVLVGEDKMPSYEAMQAYALCTNNPINESEEILLRTIDLLIAMGQRGNEVALIPYDCWVEKNVVDRKGNSVKDTRGNEISKIGIKYYAEKKFKSRIHWLADQDIKFAKRAVERLKILTEPIREIAKWQEQNENRLWQFQPDTVIEDLDLMSYLGFANTYNLYLFLKERNGISPVRTDCGKKNTLPYDIKRKFNSQFYRMGDIENLLIPKLKGHIVLKEKINGKWKIILKTSEVLSIRFDGSYRFKREANTFSVLPGRTLLSEINSALGAVSSNESVFARRTLVEANGDPIMMTSHQPRHWRNTLYELAGMSDVQQALAMGRQNLDQNQVYQHTSLRQKTQFHKDFMSFANATEKTSFLKSNIRSKHIMGDITDTYHSIKSNQSFEKAESFLNTHAMALHLTPFGGCTHDFSQAPCPKHLQCWNGCSHLHRTNTPGETERIEEQLSLSKEVLQKMNSEGEGEFGASVWKADIEKKIANLERGLLIKVGRKDIPIFPDGKPVTIEINKRKNSSV